MKTKKQPKRLLTLLLSFSVLLTSIAAKADCEDVIKAGERAIQQQQKVIDLKAQEITTLKEISAAQDTRITQLQEGRSIFKDPLFYTLVGLVVGGFIVGRVK